MLPSLLHIAHSETNVASQMFYSEPHDYVMKIEQVIISWNLGVLS
jgi:hypothetical protein